MRIEERIIIAATPEEVWLLAGDQSRYAEFMSGITHWEHAGGPSSGCGARYRMRLQVRAAEVGGLVEVVEHVDAAEMAMTAVTGLDQRLRFRVRALPPNGSVVALRISYQSPGNVLARIADALAAPTIRGHVRASLAALRDAVRAEQAGGSRRRGGRRRTPSGGSRSQRTGSATAR